MIFYLSGCDKTGKTTLANKLIKDFDSELIKVSAPTTPDVFYDYLKIICSLDLKKNYVFDRFYAGERVYAPIYRLGMGITKDQWRYLELKMMKHNPVVIYCYHDVETIAKNFKKDNEEFTKEKDINTILDLYKKAWELTILPIFKYCYSKNNYEEIVKWIPIYATYENDNVDYLGIMKSKYLFVGDSLNPHVEAKTGIRSIFNSPSGMLLVHCLLKAISAYDIMVVNSSELILDDPRHVKYITSGKNVIALGKNASERLTHANVVHNTINHPQFAKRFYGRSPEERYTREIKEVL